MRISNIVAALVALSMPAWAQSPPSATDDRIQREAETFLRPCDSLSGDDARWCALNRRNFVTAHRRAFAGDYNAQRNVAFMLRGSTPGVSANHIESCAWRLIINVQGHPQADGSDTANLRFDCGRLNAQQQAIARNRALALTQQVDFSAERR